MDNEDLCKKILKIDHVRFAGICDETGEIRYGGQREGVIRLMSSEETKRSLLQALARWKLRDDLGAKSGKGKVLDGRVREDEEDYNTCRRNSLTIGNDRC